MIAAALDKTFMFYCVLVVFYVLQAAGQLAAGVRYYPVSPWGCVIFNLCAAVLGLYGYRRSRDERWAAAVSVYILPLGMLGLAAHFYSYPLWIASFYIALTCRGRKLVKWLINGICMTLSLLPVLILAVIAVIFPMGFIMGMGGKTTVKEYYSPDRRNVAVVKIIEAVPAGGSVEVSAGRYLDMGILGKYLPDRALYYDSGTERPYIEFSADSSRITVNGVGYELR